MTIILIIFCIWGASALIHSAREKRAKENAQRIASEQARIKREMREMKQRANEEVAARIALEREQMRQAREQEKLAKEQAKQAEQIAKHEKRISDLETRMSQAEFDIQREIENLNHYNEKLAELDEDLRHAQWEIESWQKQRHLANVTKAEAKADKIRDNIFSVENKVRMAEKRLDKAQRTKDFCEKQMSA